MDVILTLNCKYKGLHLPKFCCRKGDPFEVAVQKEEKEESVVEI